MSDYQPRRPGSKPTPNRQRDRAGKPALGRPERGLIDFLDALPSAAEMEVDKAEEAAAVKAEAMLEGIVEAA